MKISNPLARLLCSIAQSEAFKLGVPMCIAIVDTAGDLVLFSRMDEALPASSEIAVSKAFTSATLRISTEQLGKLAQPGGVLYGIQNTHQGRIILFGGGFPLKLKDRVVGGLGISGGTVEEDIRVGEPVVKALEEMEFWAEHLASIVPDGWSDKKDVRQLINLLQDELEQKGVSATATDLAILTGAITLAGG